MPEGRKSGLLFIVTEEACRKPFSYKKNASGDAFLFICLKLQ